VTGLLILWYFCFLRYNQRKGAAALRRVENACLGQILEARWLGGCCLQAHLRFAAHWLDNAHITIRLRPRPLPLQWLLSSWRKQNETLTLEADLDLPPGFNLEVLRHRWLTHRQGGLSGGSRDWVISRPGPVVLTTRTHWAQELSPVVNTLMTSRGHRLISVRLRPQSPHLAATVALESLTDQQTAAAFLDVLRDLAAGASTQSH
jgi:hypothetical protein